MNKEYDNYIVFVLGADNFELSMYMRSNPKHYGIDELYDFCVKVAQDFQVSEENKDLSLSQYTALGKFLDKNTLKYMEIYDKGKF